MRKTSIIIAAAVIIGLAGFAGTASAASFACVKAKVLKTPAPTGGPNSNVDPEVIGGPESCTKYKVSTICFPASVGNDSANNTDIGQCCYKAKCTPDVTVKTAYPITSSNSDAGAASFSVTTKKKVSNVCVPCDVQ